MTKASRYHNSNQESRLSAVSNVALGRCSCVMIIDRQEYRCGHICCETCEAATEA